MGDTREAGGGPGRVRETMSSFGGKVVQDARRIREKLSAYRKTLVGAFGIMVVAMVVSGGLNYLFNMVMARMLPKHDWGDLYFLMTVFLVVTMAAGAIQTVVAKYVAQFGAVGEDDKTRVLAHSYSRWLIWTGAVVIVLSIAVAWPLKSFMHLASPVLIIVLGTSMAFTFYLTLPFGLLQGQKKFLGLGGASVAAAVLRIVAGVVFVLVGFGVCGAVGAGAVASLLVVLAVVYYYRDIFHGRPEPVEGFRPVRTLRFFVPVAVALFFIILMTQIDVLIVKRLFPGQAGTYSYGALAGKAVLFMPDAISLVMFPRVSELKALGKPTRGVLWMSLAAVTVMVALVAGFYTLFPGFTAWFFSGGKGKEAAYLVGMFGLVMGVLAVTKVLAFYQLALERKLFIVTFVAAAAAEIAGIMLFHRTLRQVLMVMLVVGLCLLAANIVTALREPAAP